MSTYPLLTNAFLNLTNQCNLCCRYCFVCQNKEEMPLQVAMDAVNYLIANGKIERKTPAATFFGGEPTLRFDDIIVPVVEYVHDELGEKFDFSITTNGTLLTPERLHWMRKHRIGLLLSVDGAKETQDYNRPFHSGKGSFDRLSDILDQAVTFYPQVMFRSTLIPATVHNFYDNVRFAESRSFKNIYAIPNVYEEWDEEHVEILRQELAKYGDYYVESFINGTSCIKLMPFEKAFGKIWRINNATERRCTTDCLAQGKCGFCTNGHGAIDVHGNIYACQELPSSHGVEDPFCIGNIYSGIDQKRHEALIAMYDISMVRGANCDSCKINYICDGGCVANNYMLNGSLNVIAPIFCRWNQMLVDEAHRVAVELGLQKNELFRDRFTYMISKGGWGL